MKKLNKIRAIIRKISLNCDIETATKLDKVVSKLNKMIDKKTKSVQCVLCSGISEVKKSKSIDFKCQFCNTEYKLESGAKK